MTKKIHINKLIENLFLTTNIENLTNGQGERNMKSKSPEQSLIQIHISSLNSTFQQKPNKGKPQSC